MTETASAVPAQRPAGEAGATQPVTQQPVAEQPVTGEPVTGQAVADEPVTGQAVADEPVTGEPVTGQAVAGEPVTGEPVTEQAVAGEPATQHPNPLDRAHEVVERVSARAGEVASQVGDAMDRAAHASGRVAASVVERLRNNAELAAERGTTTIANEVVAKIAGIAARDVPGVYDLGGDVARVFAAVKERIGLGETDEEIRGVRVRLDGRSAVINIILVVEFGFVVHSVTEKVRAKVISSVENLLGLEVREVNIVVDDVHVDESGPVGDDEARAATYQ